MESQNGKPKNIEAIFDVIQANEPKPIEAFVPDKKSSEEQKRLFFDVQISNPKHLYIELAKQDFGSRESILQNVLIEVENQRLDTANQLAYKGLISRYIKINEYMRLCNEYNIVDDEALKSELAKDIMELNIKLYGEPNETTYRSLLTEALAKNVGVNSPVRELLTQELNELIDVSYTESQAFQPSEETIKLAQNAVLAMYGGLLSHIPDNKEEFNPEETRQLFEEIITSEFGESARGWKVILSNSASINVVASEKLIKIPIDRQPISQQKMHGLVVHEIGVHVLRSIMGESSNVLPLKLGLSGYMDSEEGLAIVMEQSIMQKYSAARREYYIAAGLAYFEGKDYRGVFEVIWRLNTLSKLKDNQSEEDVAKVIQEAKDSAYRQTLRIFRGTDDLPWFKDVAYDNGAKKDWSYLEDFGADFTTFSMLLMGKADPTNEEHRRILFETKSKV